jgi:hypothetical protein
MSRLAPTLAEGCTPEPGDDSDHMHGGGMQERLEVRARPADVSTPAPINAPDPWGEATFDTRPQRVRGCERGRLLALPCRLECLVVRLQSDGELPWGVFR